MKGFAMCLPNSLLITIHFVLLILFLSINNEPAVSSPTRTEMVAMRDWVKLATDLYIPDGDKDAKYPVILIRSPYERPIDDGIKNLGFVLVYQGTRGRFGSEGRDIIFLDDGWGKTQDGYDTVEWIAKQPWCNGKIGTFGASAPGITQYMMAGSNPPSLTCMSPIFAGGSLYHYLFFESGAYRQEIMDPWLDGCKFDEQTLENIKNNPAYNDYWRQYDLSTRYDKVNFPILHIAGWYDIFTQGNIDAFIGIQKNGGPNAKGKQKLIIGPYSHAAAPEVGEFKFPDSEKYHPIAKSLEWLQYMLQGVDNEAAHLNTVTYYVMGAVGEEGAPGNEWRSADSWPIPAKTKSLYLNKNGTLTNSRPDSISAKKTYKFDPDDPVPTVGGRNLVLPAGPYDQRSTESRSDVVLFTTETLDEPLEATGRIKVRLWASSSAKDTDFTAKLTDVYPDGRSMLVCEGIARARYHKSFEKPSFLTKDEVYEFSIDLWSTSIIFNKGHKIRLAISSSNSIRYDVNPNTGNPIFTETKKEIAENTIYFNRKYPSALLLPIPILHQTKEE